MLRRSRRGSVHGNALARLHALEVAAAARHSGPILGWEDPLSLAVHADGGRVYASAREFFEAGRRGDKLPLLIRRDVELSPHNRPPEESTPCPN